jgi:hypothetical protein
VKEEQANMRGKVRKETIVQAEFPFYKMLASGELQILEFFGFWNICIDFTG